jgi:glycosyltransferase involved in cell wall biosynthesis
MTTQRQADAVAKIKFYYPKVNLHFLGEGYSSVVFHDGSLVYKIHLLSELEATGYKRDILNGLKTKLTRFSGSDFFYELKNFIVGDDFFILSYPYEQSNPCDAFTFEEMELFLAECWRRKVIFQDLKPDNFIRVNGKLKWIDYEPDKYTDNLFLNMAVRAFVYCKYGENKDREFLIKLCRSSVNQFHLQELEGVQQFCNRVFSRIIFVEALPIVSKTTSGALKSLECQNEEQLIRQLSMTRTSWYSLPYQENFGFQRFYFGLIKQGYFVDAIDHDILQLTEDNYFTPSKLHFHIKQLRKPQKEVSLLIKACAQDSDVIYKATEHIIRQTASPNVFCERILALDIKEANFLRSYNHQGGIDKLESEAQKLVADGLIDRIVKIESAEIHHINKRWFDVDSANTHTIKNVPVAAQLHAFEQTKGDYILQMDCDVMIGRRDYDHSFLNDMITATEENENVVCVGFNICKPIDEESYMYFGYNGEFAPEVRCGLIHKERLLNLRPLPNEELPDGLKLSWYRSVQQRQKETGKCSIRGGKQSSFYIHPANYRKTDKDVWFTTLDRVEQNQIPTSQINEFDLCGSYPDWTQPKRNEKLVVITCLRNVSYARFLRCWYSLLAQSYKDWGLIIVDDSSDNGLRFLIEQLVKPYYHKVTFIANRFRVGLMANVYKAIHYFMDNRESIVVMLDGDDALIGNKTLKNILEKYERANADVVVGKMYRTDKLYEFYPYPPNFLNPRLTGGNVWQHLRSFKKNLFDSLRLEDLKISNPKNSYTKNSLQSRKFSHKMKFPEYCEEFAYMIPIVEMSTNPIHINNFNYFHERSTPNTPEIRIKKEKAIAEILNKRPKSKADILNGRRQFLPNQNKIEIDITYECNLKCINCNRSSTQAPTKESMPLALIKEFVKESIELNKKWELINLLGGEPTIHPEFLQIVDEILYNYIEKHSQDTVLQITSNGYGDLVRKNLDLLPKHKSVVIDVASFKDDRVIPYFSPFNQAPVDKDNCVEEDYGKGCWVTSYCGIGLNHMGYYPCGVAGGIDRVMKLNKGVATLKEVDDSMKVKLNDFCRYCGNFSDYAVNNGDFIPRCEKGELKKAVISSTWKKAYQEYNDK